MRSSGANRRLAYSFVAFGSQRHDVAVRCEVCADALLRTAARRPSALRLRLAHRRLSPPPGAPAKRRRSRCAPASSAAPPRSPRRSFPSSASTSSSSATSRRSSGSCWPAASRWPIFRRWSCRPSYFGRAACCSRLRWATALCASPAARAAADARPARPRALAAWRALGVPLAGPALGVVTALAAPLTYPLSFALAWPDPNASGAALWAAASDPELYDMVRWLAYNEVMVPCLAVTGAASRLLLHVGLEPLVVGRPRVAVGRASPAPSSPPSASGCARSTAAALRVDIAASRRRRRDGAARRRVVAALVAGPDGVLRRRRG